MSNEVNKYIKLLNEERITNRLRQQAIDEQEEKFKVKEKTWKEKECALEKRIKELQTELKLLKKDVKGYEADLKHSDTKIEEYESINKSLQEDIKELRVENKELQEVNEELIQKLQKETMTVANLNSLILLQNQKISDLEKSAQQTFKTTENKRAGSSSSVSRSRTKAQPLKSKYHQQSTSESFSRKPSNNIQFERSSLSPSNSSSQASTSPIEKSRSSKRPLEMDENDREVVYYDPSTSSNNKNIRKSSCQSTARNRIEQSDDVVVDLSDGSSSPPTAYYFKEEQDENDPNSGNSVIDLSNSIPSLESVIDHASFQNVTNPSQVNRDSIPNVKYEEQEEVIADFTSLLTPTPRPALSDSTNNHHNIPKGKNVILKTTSNANLLNNVTSASNKRHQHGAGQTCKGCDKFYDTEPLRDVENNNAILSTKDRIQLHSKHRTRNDTRATTPPGFWDIDFTLSSQGVNK